LAVKPEKKIVGMQFDAKMRAWFIRCGLWYD